MDHAEALELIELAAVEPDGLERLMAGDTPHGAAVAGHLAGCPPCVGELARVRRTSAIVRAAIASEPDPALRERTLAFVREVGRDRSGTGTQPWAAEAAATPGGPPAPVAMMRRPAPPARRWLAYGAVAAALVLGIGLGLGAAAIGSPAPDLRSEIAVLQDATAATMRLEAQPDRLRVALAPTTAGDTASGTLLLSPSTGELVMVAEGLPALAAGEEYGCWVEVGGSKTRIGHLYAGGGLQAWVGTLDGLAALPPGAVFGVSRVPAGSAVGEPVLLGEL